MRNGIPLIRSTERSLTMLEAILSDRGRSSVAAVARAEGIPVASAHRQVATLAASGYLITMPGGKYVAGPRLLRLLRGIDERQIIADLAIPRLDELAGELNTVVHLGTLENGMVTYRVKTGRGSAELFTQVGMQLEAYCSGIGKVLLAHLPEFDRESYLANGPFPALTSNTITDPAELRLKLQQVRAEGFGLDQGEIMEGVYCAAVPVLNESGSAQVAISATFAGPRLALDAIPSLTRVARVITRDIFAHDV